MVVQSLMAEHGLSGRRACIASGNARRALRYRPVPRDSCGVINFAQDYMALNPRHGFGLLHVSACHQGQPWVKTLLWRVYCELRLNLPCRDKKRQPARIKQPLEAAGQPNRGWSWDFMPDALWSGRRFRTFNVIDEFNREGLRTDVDTSLPAARVIRAFNELVEVRRAPLSIRLDNGPEFIARALACQIPRQTISQPLLLTGSGNRGGFNHLSLQPGGSTSGIRFRRHDLSAEAGGANRIGGDHPLDMQARGYRAIKYGETDNRCAAVRSRGASRQVQVDPSRVTPDFCFCARRRTIT